METWSFCPLVLTGGLTYSTRVFIIWLLLFIYKNIYRSHDSSVGRGTRRWARRPEFDLQKSKGFFSPVAPRPALWPTQPPFQFVPEALSLGINRPGCETNNSHLLPRLLMVKLYLHSPKRLNGIVLNYIITYRNNFNFTVMFQAGRSWDRFSMR
jgi:hypothetical protein